MQHSHSRHTCVQTIVRYRPSMFFLFAESDRNRVQQASFYVYCLEVGSKHFDQSPYDPHSTKHPRVSIWYQFFLHVLLVQVVLLWECQCNVSTMLPRCGKMVLYRGSKMQTKTRRCLFCDLLNCHWQSLGFVSGLLHLSEKCTLYICKSIRVEAVTLRSQPLI